MFKNNTITNNSKFNGLDSVIKKSLIIAGLSFSTLNAGFLDAIVSETVNAVTNSGDKKVEKGLSVRSSNAELGKRRVPPTSSNSNKGDTSLKLGKPSKSLIALTECTNLKLSNVILGYGGTYTYKNGFKKEKSSGFIKRQKGKVTNTCVLPSLNPGQVVYLEVNEKKFKALGNSNNWSMQCVWSANPDAGALSEKESAQEHAKVGFLSQKEMMLQCGNSEGIKECAKGNNSSRARAWKKKLAKNGKKMISVLATKSPNAPKGGEKLYCQYYNSNSGKSLFVFEYIRTK